MGAGENNENPEAETIAWLNDVFEEAQGGTAASVDLSFSYVTRDPITGEMLTDEEGLITGDKSYGGQLLGVSATSFTVAVTYIEHYPDEDKHPLPEPEEIVKALLAGTFTAGVIKTDLESPEIHTIEIADVCVHSAFILPHQVEG